MPLPGARVWFFAACAALISLLPARAQIDPAKRQLLQLGYNAFFQGHAPLAGYGFYYLNRPEFWKENLTLRMAVAPVYFDSELGISQAIGPNTHLGVGLAGGGFADSYNEVRMGKFIPKESFDGYGGGASLSLYHLFNPGQRIPLHGIMRGGVYYSAYTDSDDTARRFDLPDDRASANFRTGLRFGGKEPVLFPSLAMELSIWFESLNRGNSGEYGYAHDRDVHSSSELFYAHGFLAYTFERGDNASVALTAGTSANTDRFSAFRLGGVLPLVAEYPLVIPGYYYQEISATRFVLLNGSYAFPLDEKKRWQLTAMAATAVVDYLHGTGQSGRSHSGVGGGIYYKSVSETWKAALTYGYGFNAIRDGGRGSHVVGMMVQIDLENWWNKRKSAPFWWEPK